MSSASPAFRYESARHEYFLGEQRIPSITQLIERGGLVTGADFMTEASRRRGTAIHELCCDHDLGVDVGEPLKVSPWRSYVLAYISAVDALKPEWECIEEADVHPVYKFAGRTDRIGLVFGQRTVCEIKSAVKAKHHSVQTALQSLLASARWPLPAMDWQRLCVYLTHNGRYTVERHEDRRDFDTAKDLIRRFC